MANNMFFAAMSKEWYGKMNDFNRLYAYPKLPEPNLGKKIIIDSGTYELYCNGKTHNHQTTKELAQFHQKCVGDCVFVAPDVPRNARLSIKLFEFYKQQFEIDIKPCFHFSRGVFDLFEFKTQYENYSKMCDMDFVFINDKKLKGGNSLDVNYYKSIVRQMRFFLGEKANIHVFSAGKTHAQVKGLCTEKNVSFDTTNWQFDCKNETRMMERWGVNYSINKEINAINILKKIDEIITHGL